MKKRAITGFGIVLLFVLAFAILFYTQFQTIEVKGVSMEPTFKNGQRLLSSRAYWLIGPVRKNDIVVVREDEANDYIIKRVYRMPGEVVDWVNVPVDYNIANGEYRVPQGTFYVLGDNRDHSEDSRKFGPIPADKVLGKVVIGR